MTRIYVLILAILIVLLLVAPASAQESQPLAWDSHRQLAQAISTALVGANVGMETWHAWQASDRKHALLCEGVRNGLTIGAAEVVKRLADRWRPDHSNQMSFYSEHTALAAVNAGWRLNIAVPIVIGAGYGRAAANRHYLTDIAVGGAAGYLATKVCHP